MIIIIHLLVLLNYYIISNPDPTKLEINYFKENSKLYYVNAMNDEDGNLFFEFWGENDNMRYIIGKYADNDEPIKFKGNEIFSINSGIFSTYHDSIIIKSNDENINIFNLDYNNTSFINLNQDSITFNETKKIVISEYKNKGEFSYRNSIIKLSKINIFFL